MSERLGAIRSEPADPLIGRTINERFRITRLIARGGMGKVYLAEQAPLGRLCAVKVLNPSYAGGAEPEFHKRFFLEATTTSRLSHPNTVTIFDYGRTEDDYYFMAMEYLEGQTLHQAIRRDGFLVEERAVNIATQICRGLREAHSIGVIHRDLKPANIFLVKHGDELDFVKILDFGLVKNVLETSQEQITQTGLFMGSPKYMAPEQIHGHPVDARTDIYSLGIVLCEMLTGRVPFDRATSVSILMAHVSEAPPHLSSLKPDVVVSPDVEDVVRRCLAKNPDDRYRSMDELLLALRVASGASLTGQVVAFGGFLRSGAASSSAQTVIRPGASGAVPLHASGSGPRMGPVSGMSGVSSSGGISRVSSSGDQELRSNHNQTPMSLAHSDMAFAPRERKGVGVPVAMALTFAVGLGGLAGLIAFRAANPSTVARPVDLPLPSADPVASSSPSASAPARTAMLRVDSTPSGASVWRDGVELCPATPCSLTLSGPDASPTKLLSLVVRKQGFKAQPVDARVGDGKVAVQLASIPIAVGPSPRPVAPPKTSSEPAPMPSGFKDIPY